MQDVSKLQIYQDYLANFFPSVRATAQLLRSSGNASLQNHVNPLTNCGGKVYSQNDEDGISFEILRRIGIVNGVFAEFGVGNGTENNTLALAAAGWSGFWVGGEDLAFDFNPLQATTLNFHYQKHWIKQSNIVELYNNGLAAIKRKQCDLISLDLDGNDYYFVEALLSSGAHPEVFIVEYNAKFRPPIKFKIEYDDNHTWDGSDYFGASLATFVELFEAHGYFLACCNITGANAFFVKAKHRPQFADIATEIDQLYASPKYFLTGFDVAGHWLSLRAIVQIFKQLNAVD